eukprot:6246873-Amphidinium_carterae.1
MRVPTGLARLRSLFLVMYSIEPYMKCDDLYDPGSNTSTPRDQWKNAPNSNSNSSSNNTNKLNNAATTT